MPATPFVDSRIVAQTFALQRRVCPPPLKTDRPLVPQSQAYGSVLRGPDDVWRMWYLVFTDYCEYFATSSDGLNWDLPELDLVADDVKPECPTPNAFMSRNQKDRAGRWLAELRGPEGFSVLDAELTPHPAARSRFTALYLARFSGPPGKENGLCLAHSDDGIHWLADERNPVLPGWRDTGNQLLFDPRLGRYVWYGRPHVYVNAVTRANRLIARAESEDLANWSAERIVLDTDEQDAPAFDLLDETALREGVSAADAQARARQWAQITEGAVTDTKAPVMRGRNRQWYGITVFPCADLYLGLAWMYDLLSGEMWPELCHSYDGIDWRREAVREPFLRPPPGVTSVTMSSPPVEAGDEQWIYWSHSDRSHHATPSPSAAQHPKGVRVSALPRDRWVAYAAGDQEGELLTHVMPRPGRLALNAAVEQGGHVRVEVLDAWGEPQNGFTLAESRPLAGDGLELEPEWQPGRPLGALPECIRLRLTARRARLYGIGC